MPTTNLTREQMQQALDLTEQYGRGRAIMRAIGRKAAKEMGLPSERVIDYRADRARLLGMRPAERKDAPRVYEKKRLGRMHIWIPDVQAKTGVRSDHLEWIGNYVAEKKPDVLGCIGDFWDFPSLSSYDKGKLAFEGRRYVNDIKAGRHAMERLLKPIDDYNRSAKPHEKYSPDKHFTLGNHDVRPSRFVDSNPEFMGKFDLDDLGLHDYGWKVHDFLKVVTIDGIEFAHYFTSGVMGRPVSSAAALLRERQKSCAMGHVQTFDMAVHKKTQNIAMMMGCCYLHDEDYLGPQGNNVRRQIVVMHEVEDGTYDPMLVSLKFLEKNYS